MGTETQPQYNPDTGQIETVPVKQKPGNLFRSLLAGALLGGAVGAEPVHHAKDGEEKGAAGGGGFWGAFARGAGAGAERGSEMAARRQQAAQSKAQQAQQQDKESQLAAATAAIHNINELSVISHADMLSPDLVMKHNNSSEQVLGALKNVGAIPARLTGADGADLNDKLGNATALMTMHNKNPESVMQGPDGYHRVGITRIDTSGLTMKPGGGWQDASGKDVDVNSRLRISLVDVPISAWNKQITLTKGDINAASGYPAYPKDQESQTVRTTIGGVFAAKQQNTAALHDARLAQYPHIKNEGEYSDVVAKANGVLNDPNSTDKEKEAATSTRTYADNWLKTNVGAVGQVAKAKEAAKPPKQTMEEQAFAKAQEDDPDLTATDFHRKWLGKTGSPKVKTALDANERDKANAFARIQKNYHDRQNAGKVSEEDALSQYHDELQDAQDNYEHRIETITGFAVGHNDVTTWDKPQLPGAPAPTAARPAPGTAQRPQGGGQAQVFSPTKWKAANPNGDVAAATAQAKQQGMQIAQ